MSYKKKILIAFSLAFCILAALVIMVELRNGQNSKRAILQSRLEGYADIIDKSGNPSEVIALLPEELRVTVMDRGGKVSYDSYESADILGNHLERPEVKDCLSKGFGHSIRTSETSGIEYLYYAKSYEDGKIVRLALPFEIDLKRFIRPDYMPIFSILLIFLVMLLTVMLLWLRYDKKNDEIGRKKIKELKNRMTSDISHELKTPVSSIRGYLETLSSFPDMDEKTRNLYIERSYQQTLRLSDTIRDITIINKMEEDPAQFNLEKLSIREIADEVFTEFEIPLKRAEMWVENEIAVHSEIYGNYKLLYSLFRNLVENSLKYAGTGSRIHLECDNDLNFKYYDTGKGVPEEHLDKIFDRFYRIDKGRGREEGGSGLGLSIVKNAVLFHGGTIIARNRPEGGLEFRFNLKDRK